MILSGDKILSGGKLITDGVSPENISGLIGDWDASKITGLIAGDFVGSIADSVNGNTLLPNFMGSPTVGGKYQLLANGMPYVSIENGGSVSSNYRARITQLDGATEFTFVIIMARVISLATTRISNILNSSSSSGGTTIARLAFNAGATNYGVLLSGVSYPIISTAPSGVGDSQMVSMMVDNQNVTTSSSRTNNIAVPTAFSFTTAYLHTTNGQSGSGNWGTHQIILFNRKITPQENNQLFMHMRKKWLLKQ